MLRSSFARVVGLAAVTLILGYSSVNALLGPATPPPAPAEPAAPAAGAAAPAVEIDEARVLAGLELYKEGGCRGCHGWAADGTREGPNPGGPSLRASLLPLEFIEQTISCGRPGTAMPYFWRDGYRRDSTECYGQTAAQLGDRVPQRGGERFTAEEIDDLAYFIEYYVKGRTDITLEECEFYFGAGNAQCNFYRR
ncbi:MAG: cytochrome c [Bauldia sp.]